MRVAFFARIVRVLWLGLFIYAVTVGVGYGKEEGAKRAGVEPAVVSGGVQSGKVVEGNSQAEKGGNEAQINWIIVVPSFVIAAIGWGLFFYQRKKIKSDAVKRREGELEAEKQFKEKEKESDTKTDYERYQDALKGELGYIRMLGLPGVESVKVNLNDDTFVPLRIFRSHDPDRYSGEENGKMYSDDAKALTPDEVMQDAFKKRRMLLVIGDPGAGKTTLLKYYALCALDSVRSLRLGFSGVVNVFYLPLRELVCHEKGQYKSLAANLAHWSDKHHLPLSVQFFDEWLRNGTSLVLLDGLDEISNVTDRIQVCKWIDNAWSGLRKQGYFVVTSRMTGYRKDEGIELEADYERADVIDFSIKQQGQFLMNWFNEAFLKELCEEGVATPEMNQKSHEKAAERTRKIIDLLKEDNNKGLRQLAAVPMILQIMAILWKDRDYLPESRVALYNAVLDYLLELRDKRRDIAVPVSATRARMVLGPVSLWMQEELKTDEVEREKMQVKMQERLDILREKNFIPPSVEDFCTHLVNRAGLLVEHGAKSYMFRHKSFREYLAGVDLVRTVLQNPKYLDTLISGFDSDWWEEPMRFFIAQVDEKTFDLFMEKLFDSPVIESLTPTQQLLLYTLIEEAPQKKIDALCKKLLDMKTTDTRQRVILECLKIIGKLTALDTLHKFKVDGLAKNKDIADRAEEVMFALVDLKRASELQKAESGEKFSSVVTVSRIILKDRQPSFRNPNEHNAEYIRISGGSYIYSHSEKKELVEDLYVAKYPVTNKLYRSFIASLQARETALGAELEAVAKGGLWGSGFVDYLENGKSDIAALFRSGYDEERKFDGEDQPVVAVTWYAAQAYCLWLSLLEGDKALYRLPTEIEWEWVAGGQQGTVGKKVRDYPWPKKRGAPTSKLANFGNNVGATTPVGRYPEGATPEGLYDMAGNVWEWTESIYNENTPKKDLNPARSVRGGSWISGSDSLRCSFRSSYHPENGRDLIVGFRVVRPSHSLSFGDSENLSI